MSNNLNQQLQFILEIDKLKQVLRQTLLTDSSRQENSAEHSWHLAVMAIAPALWTTVEQIIEKAIAAGDLQSNGIPDFWQPGVQ